MQVQSLGQEDPLEKEMATISSILVWRIPWTEELGGLQSTELQKFSSVHSLNCVRLFVTPWIAARQASLSTTNSRSLLRLMSIELVMPSSHLILCRPLLLLPPIPPSIRVFSNESTLHEVAKILEFQLQHQSFQCCRRARHNLVTKQQPPGSQTPLLMPRSFSSLEESPVLIKQMKTTGCPDKFEFQINNEEAFGINTSHAIIGTYKKFTCLSEIQI